MCRDFPLKPQLSQILNEWQSFAYRSPHSCSVPYLIQSGALTESDSSHELGRDSAACHPLNPEPSEGGCWGKPRVPKPACALPLERLRATGDCSLETRLVAPALSLMAVWGMSFIISA